MAGGCIARIDEDREPVTPANPARTIFVDRQSVVATPSDPEPLICFQLSARINDRGRARSRFH